MTSEPLSPELLFQQALDFPAHERAAFLAGACRADPTLREKVERLLRAHDHAAGFLPAESKARRVETVTAENPITEGEGTLIGRYKLLERLGEGGFGLVWAAEQREPVRRRVALKIIKLGMDTRQVVARFEAERQALALMDHPNIARVLDAGTTDSGRPFFVMELVKGIPITTYCDREKLDTKARLDLFIKVCHAIQHAHQKGIIHRDIKPSNIMVTLHDGVPVPKVIDFGIAKATQQELTDKTIYTQFSQFIGTPAYMSPEQAEMSGLDIDTRSDIYSLGVLLYELLTGTTPFDTRELLASGLDEMRKIIREREPIRPSTRLTQMTDSGAPLSIQTSKPKIENDLDWIVMKCLEKDRTRRYETANGLSMDLKRHLDHEPIVARPPSTSYRILKAWQRNKVSFSAAAIVVLALIAGGGISSWQAAAARKARSAEERQRLTAEESSRRAIANAATAETQRKIAEENARAAEAAIKLAEKREVELLRRAYAADINLAQQSIANNNLGRGLDLLNRYRPRDGEPDLRGWEWRYLWSLGQSDAEFELCRLPGPDPVCSVALSPDGQWAALGSYDRSGVQVWDIANRRQIASFAAGEGYCHAAFSPDGRWLALSGREFLFVWDCARREIVARARPDRPVVSVGFSGDSRKIVTFTESDAITIWNAADLQKVRTFPSPTGQAWLGTPFTFSPDLTVAVRVEGWDQVVAVELDSGAERWRKTSTKGFAHSLAISPDGKWLACAFGLTHGSIYLFNIATGQEVAVLPGHRAWVSSLVFWPDGSKLASASADQTIRLWDMKTFETLRTLQGHTLEVWSLALSPRADSLISGGKDGSVLVWNLAADKNERSHWTLPGRQKTWTFSENGRGLLTVDSDTLQIREWTGENDGGNRPLHSIDLARAGYSAEAMFQFSPSASRLAVLSTNGNLGVWDLKQGRRFSQFSIGDHGDASLHFSRDESRIWVFYSQTPGMEIDELTEWDLTTERPLQSIPSVRWPNALAPDRWLFVSSRSGVGRLRNLQTGQTFTPTMFTGRLAVLYGAPAFSQDGEQLVVSHDAGFLTVWRTQDLVSLPEPQPIRTLGGILMSFHSSSFSPDSSRLFGSSHGSEAIKIWETATYHELITLEANAEGFSAPGLSPDGRNLVVSSGPRVFVWRAASWEEINRPAQFDSRSARRETD